MAHWFWTLLAVACGVWYATITVYVTYRGALDVRGMLKQLKEDHAARER